MIAFTAIFFISLRGNTEYNDGRKTNGHRIVQFKAVISKLNDFLFCLHNTREKYSSVQMNVIIRNYFIVKYYYRKSLAEADE